MEHMPAPKPVHRIAGLDGLRSIAVICVFLHHAFPFGGNLGSVGVWLFFVLSGFLVIPIAEKSIASDGLAAPGERFLKMAHFSGNRFLRIFPIYFALLGGFTLLALLGVTHKPIPGFLEGAPFFWTYTTNFHIAAKGEFINVYTHLWSLAIEFQFYIVIALIILFCPRKIFWNVIASIYAVCMAFTLFMLFTADPIVLYVNSIVGFAMMLTGGLTARLLHDPGLKLQLRRYSHPVPMLGLLLALHIGLNALRLDHVAYLVTPLMGGVLIAMIVARPEALSFLESKPFKGLGTISYGFYLFHPFVIAAFREGFAAIAQRTGQPGIALFEIPLAFVATTLLAWLSWNFFEKRILRHKFTYDATRSRRLSRSSAA